MTKFKFGDKVSYRSCKNAFYLQETDDIRSLIAVEKFGAIKGAVITVITNELTPATDWVKCSERMPPKNGVYLCILKSKNNDFTHVTIVDFYDDDFDVGIASNVIGWMPLPDLPTEVE